MKRKHRVRAVHRRIAEAMLQQMTAEQALAEIEQLQLASAWETIAEELADEQDPDDRHEYIGAMWFNGRTAEETHEHMWQQSELRAEQELFALRVWSTEEIQAYFKYLEARLKAKEPEVYQRIIAPRHQLEGSG